MKTKMIPRWFLALALGSAAVPLALTAAGCSVASDEKADDIGTVELALVTQTAGVTYRLTGTFNITGPTDLTIDTADDPTATVRTADLPIGIYTVTLAEDFAMERDAGDGTYEPIAAELITPNPQSFIINSLSTTNVTFSFGIEGQVIEFGEGTLELDIDVEDQSNGPVSLIAAAGHTCALMANGAVRCWGGGVLGYGNMAIIGDGESPASAGDVDVGGVVTQLDALSGHTCAVLDFGAVRCWGDATALQLGSSSGDSIGDDETPASAGNAVLQGNVSQLAAGGAFTCALLESGDVQCWGGNIAGQLGAGSTSFSVAAEDTDLVNIGATVRTLEAGAFHTCAILDSGNLRCWGNSSYGQLGYGNVEDIGDDELPVIAGDVPVGGSVVQVDAGFNHTCALLDTGAVRCWGLGASGQLGYGNTNNIGDNEPPTSAGDVNIGGAAIQIALGYHHSCALLDTGAVRCWGRGASGQLGYGNTNNIGDSESPASAGSVNLGAAAVSIAAGGEHTCAVLVTGAVRCWGANTSGQLGYGHTNNIGDNEQPASAGDVEVGYSTAEF